MPIFSRREIQKRIDLISKNTAKSKLERLINQLNLKTNDEHEAKFIKCLAAEWEVVLVSSFSMIGSTYYEKKISNNKTPDIYFQDTVNFICDITSVSDAEQHNKNPATKMAEFLRDVLIRHKLPGVFSFKIFSIDIKGSANSKITRLLLPPISDMKAYLDERLSQFFQQIINSPHTEHQTSVEEIIDDKTIKFTIFYNPSASYSSGSYRAYTNITSIYDHILFRRLCEKLVQFNNTTENMPRLVIVCDNGCSALHNPKGDIYSFSVDEAIDEFWKNPIHPRTHAPTNDNAGDISAILIIGINECHYFGTPQIGGNKIQKTQKLYANPYAKIPLTDQHIEVINKVIREIPQPIRTPDATIRELKKCPRATRHLEKYEMNSSRVRISSIDLLKILSGEIAPKEYWENYGHSHNLFRSALLNLSTITKIQLHKLPEIDDDMIEIEFELDPALSDFLLKR